MINKTSLLKITQEALWWIITAAVCWLIFYPITTKIDYYYWRENLVFLISAITSIRYAIFYNQLSFLQPNIVKFLLFTANLVLWVYVLNRYEMLLQLYENFDLSFYGKMRKQMVIAEQVDMLHLIYKQILIAGISALTGIVILNVRIIGAYWRVAKIRFSTRMQE
ncbi:MAG: hypothetical protein RMJ53_01575 [Chitinophagales bacterium]|nr:hypothetical protein [Chitinophagales bacterium]MDW8272898.1 hypothetical protein [Chitinophagales bacterium]